MHVACVFLITMVRIVKGCVTWPIHKVLFATITVSATKASKAMDNVCATLVSLVLHARQLVPAGSLTPAASTASVTLCLDSASASTMMSKVTTILPHATLASTVTVDQHATCLARLKTPPVACAQGTARATTACATALSDTVANSAILRLSNVHFSA